MKQTVLNTTRVPGVLFLFYLSFAAMVASGVFCLLFLGILFNNYYAPYSPEKLDAMIRQSGESGVADWEKEPQSSDAAKAPASSTASDNEFAGNRPNIDPDDLGKAPVFQDEPQGSFLQLPSEYEELVRLRQQLAQDTGNTKIRERIRLLDQQLRVEYFRRKEIAEAGAPFLFIAACVFLFSARITTVLKRQLPVPVAQNTARQQKEETLLSKFGLGAVFLVGAICVGIAIGLFFSERSDLEKFLVAKYRQAQEEEKAKLQTASIPEPAISQSVTARTEQRPDEPQTQIAQDDTDHTADRAAALEKFVASAAHWPTFRGFDGSGTTTCKNIPTKWDVSTGEGIRWKSEISLSGHNSPILWKDRLFLTGADENERKIFCYNADDGTLLWEYTLENQEDSETKLELGVNLFEDTGFAASTAATDGERVYAIFANLDLVAVDFEGKLVWHKNLGLPDNHYGYAASLAFYNGNVIVQYDQGEGKKEGESKLIAFRGTDGTVAWETPRTIMNSWPSPIIRKIGDSVQLLTGADPWLIAYDPINGQEIWRCKAYSGGDTAASPTGYGNLVFAANAMPGVTAVDVADGVTKGDVSKTDKQLWCETNVRPDACSPIATEKYVYSLGQGPYLQCIDIEKGEMIWELEIDDYASFYSSPSMAEDRIYLFDKDIDTTKAFVIDPAKAVLTESGTELESGREKEMILSVNPMTEPVFASPAFADGRIYIRSEKTLYCMETPDQ